MRYSDLKAELEKYKNSEIGKLTEDNQKLLNMIESLKEHCRKLSKEYNDLKLKYANDQFNITNLRSDIAICIKNNDAMRNNLAHLTRERDMYIKRYEDLIAQCPKDISNVNFGSSEREISI